MRDRLSVIFIFLGSLFFFLLFSQFPAQLNFDEFHYVPAAKALWSFSSNLNWEHPPLGKYLIALGFPLGGDQPLGWRLSSMIFGSLSLCIVFLIARRFWPSPRLAWAAVGLTLFNQVHFVQSRIAMLDVFMMFFILAAIYAQLLGKTYRLWVWVGVGFALSVKWYGAVVWVALFLWNWIESGKPHRRELLLSIGIPFGIYFVTFLPLFFLTEDPLTLSKWFSLQWDIFQGQQRIQQGHPYESRWWQWPLLLRPMWYAFDKEGPHGEWVRGVFCVGNPILFWYGLVSVAVCLWKRFWFPVYLFFFFYLAWIFIPRETQFFYYYYPASMLFGFTIVESLKKRPLGLGILVALSGLVFAYFYPILVGFRIPTETFMRWMWFSSWI